MKILKIKFENIHSLKGKHEIDFTKSPLADTGIFAIVGSTGSGKSTILDIIMLALYGQMPRINEKISKTTIEKYGTVLTRNTERAFAEVEFSTNGKNYRSKWAIQRTRNGTLRDYTMEVAELPEGRIIESKKSDVPKVNEEIIGLKYEQFLKSIVLAQGSFSKFLKAKPEERTEMLEKITGSDIYRTIGRRAFEMAKEHEEKYRDKENLLQGFDILSEEKKQEITENKKILEENIIKFSDEIKQLSEQIKIKTNIEKLTLQITDLQVRKDEIEKEIIDFQTNSEKLKIHEKLIILKADLQEYKNLQKISNELTISLNSATEKKKNLEKDLEINELKLKNTQNNLSKTVNDFEEIQPELERVRELSKNKELNEQELQITKQNSNKTRSEFETLDKQKSELENEHKKLISKKNTTSDWLAQNVLLKELNVDYIVIEQALKNYSESKKRTTKSLDESIFRDKFPSSWVNHQEISQAISEDLSKQIFDLKSKINNNSNIEYLKSKYDKILLEIPILEKQIENSIKYSELSTKKEQISSKINSLNTELLTQENLKSKTSNEIEITSKFIEELRAKYEREQLEAKYEQDRLKLKKEEECPLCGSIHHPFVEQNRTTKVDITKEELKKNEIFKTKLENKIKEIISVLSEKKSDISALQNNLNDVENQIKTISELFDKNNKIINKNFKICSIQDIQKYYKILQEQKNNISTDITNSENLEKFKSQLQIINSLAEKIKDVLNYHSKAKNILNKYNAYYKGILKPNQILAKLKQEENKFSENSKLINKFENEIAANEKIYAEKIKQNTLVEEKLKTAYKKTENIQNKIEKYSSQIQTIINTKLSGMSVNIYEKTIRKKIDELKTNKSEIKNILIKTTTQITETKNDINEFTTKLNDSKITFEKISTILIEKLYKIGFDSVDEAFKGLLYDNEAENIKQKYKQLHDSKLSINQSITDVHNSLEIELKKDNKETKLLELKNKLKTKEEKKQSANQQIGSIKTTLETDKLQKEKLSSLQQEIKILKTEFERWEALNKVIGDAKGKKFAEVAHQFTLTELIAISNKHLKNFTARYILGKTNDSKNNLFVYDTYMGLTERSVHTLSGGETFLVSLSMALALSDLASRKTKIESLFIDEGFGTLDEETLDKALINLEKLHSDYNRTIGLISHVPEIKERINNQIVITKTNSGYSEIYIQN